MPTEGTRTTCWLGALAVVLVTSVASCASKPAVVESNPTTTPNGTIGSTTTIAATVPTTTRNIDITVALTPETIPRAETWSRTFFVAYGTDLNHVGLSRGGTESAVVMWGPETAAPVTRDAWWVVDPGNHRVALFDPTGVLIEAPIDATEKLQFIEVTAKGDIITHTRPIASLISIADGSRSPIGTAIPHAPPVYGHITRDGVISIAVDCHGYRANLTLRAAPDTAYPNAELSSGFQAICGPDGTTHLLWYGYWESASANGPNMATYVAIHPDGTAVIEPMGNIRSSHDPGNPQRLHLVPGSGQAALSIIGEEGVEGWIREQ